MKQPRSTSQTNTKLTKKALLPSFKQSKAQSKVQQFTSTNKSQLFIHFKLIPLEVLAERRNGEIVKITVNSNDAVIQEGSKFSKTTLNIPSSSDLASSRDWVHIDLGELFSHVRVKKIGDENICGSLTSMLSWERLENGDKKINATVSLKQISRTTQKTIENSTSATLNPKQDKNKQMKAFVANLMSRKLNKRSSQSGEVEPRISLKKKSQIFKSKVLGADQQLSKNSILVKINPPSTAGSIISAMSGARSFRRDLLERNLKESKVTGKSQKQTSIGDQSTFFLNHKTNANIIQLSAFQKEDYDKKKQKFDSQPYFYQKSTITSRFNNESTTKRTDSFSRQQQSISQIKNGIPVMPQKNEEQTVGDCLKDKSQHQSQEEVEEDIKRSAMLDSSIKQSGSYIPKQKKQKKNDESSECFQSKNIESSGTIYESKYQ